MKRTVVCFISVLCICAVSMGQTKNIHLVEKNKSQYKIILPQNSNKWDSMAAAELKKYIGEISGANLEIKNSSSGENEILICKDANLKPDGFIVRTQGSKIYFLSGREKGALYGVYSFLENYLGCRMYTSTVKIIPKRREVILPVIDITENPVFEERNLYYKESWNTDFSLWHKLNSAPGTQAVWGLHVHGFNELVPIGKYFKDHPEYFSEINGIRIPDGQLCLTNPDVLRIAIEELRKKMKENPSAKIWWVSQNDNYENCHCPECSKIDEAEGSPAGSMISFINKIAREFPDKIISTLAYQYSRKAPKTIKPEKNVNIVLCSIECNRSKPLEKDSASASFVKDLEEWSKISNSVMVWDYVVQFRNEISPFPNFHVLQPNIKLFEKYGVKRMFQQGAGGCIGSEFGELRNYIIAKLLWNPDINVSNVMNDFLNGYYGKAGKYLRNYIDVMTNALIKSNADLGIYGNPMSARRNYLAAGLIKKYNALFDKAELAVKNNSEILKRVKIARLPLKYAMLEQAKVLGEKENGTFVKDRNGKYIINPEIDLLLNQFQEESKLAGKIVVNEQGATVDEYIKTYRGLLSKEMNNPLGLHKPVKFLTEPSKEYENNGKASLTDGLRGGNDFIYNWLGYKAEDMDVIVDLQKTEPVKKISIDFYQYSIYRIFIPQQVEIGISNDGKDFKTVSVIKNTEPPQREDIFIKTFSVDTPGANARYVRIKTIDIKSCPKWHKRYPDKAWVFADEIVIE